MSTDTINFLRLTGKLKKIIPQRFKNRDEFIKKLEECEKEMEKRPPELKPLLWNDLSKICFSYIEEDTRSSMKKNRFRN